jgi:hypothetical protein
VAAAAAAAAAIEADCEDEVLCVGTAETEGVNERALSGALYQHKTETRLAITINAADKIDALEVSKIGAVWIDAGAAAPIARGAACGAGKQALEVGKKQEEEGVAEIA